MMPSSSKGSSAWGRSGLNPVEENEGNLPRLLVPGGSGCPLRRLPRARPRCTAACRPGRPRSPPRTSLLIEIWSARTPRSPFIAAPSVNSVLDPLTVSFVLPVHAIEERPLLYPLSPGWFRSRTTRPGRTRDSAARPARIPAGWRSAIVFSSTTFLASRSSFLTASSSA